MAYPLYEEPNRTEEVSVGKHTIKVQEWPGRPAITFTKFAANLIEEADRIARERGCTLNSMEWQIDAVDGDGQPIMEQQKEPAFIPGPENQPVPNPNAGRPVVDGGGQPVMIQARTFNVSLVVELVSGLATTLDDQWDMLAGAIDAAIVSSGDQHEDKKEWVSGLRLGDILKLLAAVLRCNLSAESSLGEALGGLFQAQKTPAEPQSGETPAPTSSQPSPAAPVSSGPAMVPPGPPPPAPSPVSTPTLSSQPPASPSRT